MIGRRSGMCRSERWVRAETLLATLVIAACTAAPSVAPSVAPTRSPSGGQPTASAIAPSSASPMTPPATTAAPPPTAPPMTTEPEVAGRWVSAGELLGTGDSWPGRIRTNAVPFGADRILVVGADNICTPGGAWDTSALSEIGNATGRWTAGASLPRPRDYFVLSRLPRGAALVAGGTAGYVDSPGFQSFISTFRLAPGSDSWARAADLTQARSMPAGSVLLDGRVLLAGGYYTNEPAESHRMLDSAEIYDPAADTWTPTGSLNEARYGAGAVTLVDGRVLVVGGWADVNGNGAAPLYGGSHRSLASSEVFDPRHGSWTSMGSAPVELTLPGIVALQDGGALVIADGRAYRFDRRSGSWSRTGSMVTRAVDRMLVGLIDGRVLAAGGTVGEDADTRYIADAEIYDPATDGWATTAPMPSARGGGTGVLGGDGSVVIVGGSDEAGQGAPSCPRPVTSAVRFELGG